MNRNILIPALLPLAFAASAKAQEPGDSELSSAQSQSAAAPDPSAEEPAPSAVAEPNTTQSVERTEPSLGGQAVGRRGSSQAREGSIPELRGSSRPSQRQGLGLDPGAPQAVGMIGGVSPSFGEAPAHEGDWLFDIHGYLQLPLRIGINERSDPGAGQKKTVLHTPPVIPGSYGDFDYTGVTPNPWAQLNFSYGSSNITGTVIIAARTVSNANGYFHPPDQLGINDAYVSYHPGDGDDQVQFVANVGAFANRYGIMGQFDLGPYGTPLIARVAGMGATGTLKMDLGGVETFFEGGFTGQLNKAPLAVEPAGWNGYSDPNAGTSYVAHGHAAAKLGGSVHLGVHAIYAFAQDDRATTTTQKDGNIGVYGADARFTLKKWGHLYLGYGHTRAKTSRSVSSVLRVLGSGGGKGLMEQYFGLNSEGTGNLNTFGFQYDFSLGNFFHAPKPFSGRGPDVVLGAFGVGTYVSSPVPEFDQVFKFKYGLGGTYTFLPFMGVGARYDSVMPDSSNSELSHSIISPQLIFKSDWASQDQVTLQYSRYIYGDDVVPARDPAAPPSIDGSEEVLSPDQNVVMLMATMWW